MMNNKRILIPLLLLAATLTLAGIIPGVILANRSDGISSLSLPPTATPRVPLSQPNQASEIEQTPAPSKVTNCTYTIHYWLNHPESWPPEVGLGGRVYSREDAYQALAAENEDIWNSILREAYVALLNIYHGASQDRIEATLMETDDWLRKNPAGSDLSQFNQEQGQTFINQLSDFNNGQMWPRACPDQTAIPTPSPSGLEASTFITPTQASQDGVPTSLPTASPFPLPTQVPASDDAGDNAAEAPPPPAEVAPPPPEPTSPPPPLPAVTTEAIAPTQPPAPPSEAEEPPAPTPVSEDDEDDRSGQGDDDDDDDDDDGDDDDDEDDDEDDDDDDD